MRLKYIGVMAAILFTMLLTCCGNGESDTELDGTMDMKDNITETRQNTEADGTVSSWMEDQMTEHVTDTEETSVSVTETFITDSVPTQLTETLNQTQTPVSEEPSKEYGVTANGYSITVENGITYVNGVLIANKTYSLPDSYAPGGLTSETYNAFMKMQADASSEGLYLFVKSGYRSYIDQKIIYADYASRDGAEAADRYSARAGHSEHQSGMAIDVNSTDISFGDTPEGIWLRENCHLYGFIIRYPEEKEQITGYMYEPWHIRYVGEELAAAVKESGLCLEEYFGITSFYG